MNAKWLLWLLPMLFAGCMGVSSTSPQQTFTVPVAYQDVYRYAVAQANMCLRGVDKQYPVRVGVDESARTAQVVVAGDFGNRFAQVDIRAVDARTSEVTVMMAGVSEWDWRAVAAMREVVEFGVPTCHSYMPKTPAMPSSLKQ